MHRLGWVLRGLLFGLPGVWLVHNPGVIRFEWWGWEGHTSFAFVLAVCVLVWVLSGLVSGFLRQLRSLWARMWGYALPADVAILGNRKFMHTLHESGAFQLSPWTWGCDRGRLSSAQVRTREAWLQGLKAAPATAWWGFWGLIQLSWRLGDPHKALEQAREARASFPSQAGFTRAVFVLLTVSGAGHEARGLLPVLRRQGVCTADQVRRLEARILLAEASVLRGAGDDPGADHRAEQAVGADKTYARALAAWCAVLQRRGDHGEVVRLVRQRWCMTGGSVVLGRLFLESSRVHGVERFQAALNLVRQGGTPDICHAFLALEAVRGELWGEAVRYVDLLGPLWRDHDFFVRLKQQAAHIVEERGAAGCSLVVRPAPEGVAEVACRYGAAPWECAVCHDKPDEQDHILCPSCGFWGVLGLVPEGSCAPFPVSLGAPVLLGIPEGGVS